MITDNGKEFKNKLLKNYCIHNNIIFCTDYHTVRILKELWSDCKDVIQKGLICFKLQKKKGYNIDYSLSEIIKIKNNTICRTIKSTPNNIFFKEFNEQEIKKINELMLDSQKTSNVYRNTFKVNEKVLINDNFNLKNNTIKRNERKYGKWDINGIIVKEYSFNSYKVKVTNNYKNILKK